MDSSALEGDQDVLDEESRADSKPCLSLSEPDSAISEIEVAEVAYSAEEDWYITRSSFHFDVSANLGYSVKYYLKRTVKNLTEYSKNVYV